MSSITPPVSRPVRVAEFSLLNQLCQESWFDLTTRTGVTDRFKRSLYWIESLSREIVPGGSRLDRRAALQSELPRILRAAGWGDSEAELLQTRLLFAWGALDYWGCYGENFGLLRRGRAPVIGRGRNKGQKVEIDHAVAVAWAPGLFNHPANLIPLPFAYNREKGSKLKPHDREIARSLTALGRLTQLELATVVLAYTNGWAKPSTAGQLSAPSPVAFRSTEEDSPPLNGLSSGPLDPRLLAARIQESCEALDAMIARGRSADVEITRVHAVFAEQASRIVRFGRSRINEAETDLETARNSESTTESWRAIQCDLWLKIEECARKAAESEEVANNHVEQWQSTLERLEEERKEAEEVVENAGEALVEAEEELSDARGRLSEAESELEVARETTVCTGHDKEGNEIEEPIDTESYEREVEAAEELVAEREEERDEADQRLDDAKEELEKALKREEAAEQAVELAEEASMRASECVEAAKSARLCGQELDEEIMRLSNLAGSIERLAEECLIAARESLENASQADSLVTAVGVQLRSSTRSFNDAFTTHSRFQIDIETRLKALRYFDRPTSILAPL